MIFIHVLVCRNCPNYQYRFINPRPQSSMDQILNSILYILDLQSAVDGTTFVRQYFSAWAEFFVECDVSHHTYQHSKWQSLLQEINIT